MRDPNPFAAIGKPDLAATIIASCLERTGLLLGLPDQDNPRLADNVSQGSLGSLFFALSLLKVNDLQPLGGGKLFHGGAKRDGHVMEHHRGWDRPTTLLPNEVDDASRHLEIL